MCIPRESKFKTAELKAGAVEWSKSFSVCVCNGWVSLVRKSPKECGFFLEAAFFLSSYICCLSAFLVSCNHSCNRSLWGISSCVRWTKHIFKNRLKILFAQTLMLTRRWIVTPLSKYHPVLFPLLTNIQVPVGIRLSICYYLFCIKWITGTVDLSGKKLGGCALISVLKRCLSWCKCFSFGGRTGGILFGFTISKINNFHLFSMVSLLILEVALHCWGVVFQRLSISFRVYRWK